MSSFSSAIIGLVSTMPLHGKRKYYPNRRERKQDQFQTGCMIVTVKLFKFHVVYVIMVCLQTNDKLANEKSL
jgi:hypothetical protein